jgi:hypothetical protein
MTRVRVVVVVLGLLMCPAVSQAEEGDWWTWLEKLSGPGPFKHGIGINQRIGCFLKPDTSTDRGKADIPGWTWVYSQDAANRPQDMFPCARDLDTVKAFLEAGFGRASTESQPLFQDSGEAPVVASATVLQFRAMARFGNGLLSAGGGPGVLFIAAPGYRTVARPILTAGVMIQPLRLVGSPERRYTRVLVVRIEDTYVGGLDAKDFGSRATYHKKGEFYSSVSIGVNLFALVGGL